MTGRILAVDDDRAMRQLLAEELGRAGFEVTTAADATEALTHLGSAPFDALLTDLNLPGESGLSLCAKVGERWPDVPVVLITAFGSLEAAVGAIRAGAWDFVVKPLELEALAIALDRAVKHHALRAEVKRLRTALGDTAHFGELLGRSPPMLELFDLLGRIAGTDSSVLVTGETGTGKELVAQALHARSPRASRPFVAVNCGAIPEQLIESELFGHVKGAFTDARTQREGLFVRAAGGTLFLDEIGELPTTLQPKLLRALQERMIRPVGGNDELPADVRVIAATNRDLEAEIEAGRFRQDLYYRLAVITVEVPPLRSRGSDVLLLAQRFLERFAARAEKAVHGLSPDAAERLLAYGWPGNVRELENAIERAVVLTNTDPIVAADLPEKLRVHKPAHVLVAADDPAELLPLHEVEKRYILRVLHVCGGNKTHAARALGLDRKTLYRKLQAWGIPEDEPPA